MNTLIFDELNISTSTVIVTTNLNINLIWLFNEIKVEKLNLPSNIKKTNQFQNYVKNLNPPFGTITLKEYKDNLSGIKIKKKKKKKKYFRNSLSLVMYVGKLITIKIPTKGKIQLTGCVEHEHSELCIKYLWEYLQQYPMNSDTYFFVEKNYLFTTLNIVMTDIVFKIGFNINRQHLDNYMNTRTNFNSLLETSFGYTGVNIKQPFSLDKNSNQIRYLEYKNSEWNLNILTFNEYLTFLCDNDKNNELEKIRKNTFLVFHSGTAIMSGMIPYYMKDAFNNFIKIIIKARPEIEEKIDI